MFLLSVSRVSCISLCSTRVLHSARVCCRHCATFDNVSPRGILFRWWEGALWGAGVALHSGHGNVRSHVCVRGRGGCSRGAHDETIGARTSGESSGGHRGRSAQARDTVGGPGRYTNTGLGFEDDNTFELTEERSVVQIRSAPVHFLRWVKSFTRRLAR